MGARARHKLLSNLSRFIERIKIAITDALLSSGDDLISSRYWGIFWLDCSDEQRILQGYANIATACGISTHDIASTKRWLAELSVSKQWLLILDNADSREIDLQSLPAR